MKNKLRINSKPLRVAASKPTLTLMKTNNQTGRAIVLLLALPLVAFGQANYATPYTFTTLAGSPGNYGSANGTGSAAQFGNPYSVAVDTNGNVYVADSYNSTIRKITPAGVVTTLAGLAGNSGSANGTGSAARFSHPYGVAVDTNGNVYVGDSGNNMIRKITPGGVVTTVAGLAGSSGSADGTASAARFNEPEGVVVDASDNIYVGDYYNHTIRKVTPAGVVTTLAGLAGTSGSADGAGNAARFYNPDGVAVDINGNVYVADSSNYTIRKVTPAGVVTTFAGLAGSYGSADGTGSAARFAYPYGVAVDTNGNVYVADSSNFTIRKVTPARVVTTLAGVPGSAGSANGTGSGALFFYPDGVAVDGLGNLYVADGVNDEIRKGYFTPFNIQVSANPTNGVLPLTVQFTAASVDSASNVITQWNWTFGDGSSSALQNPSHTYQSAGIFYPSLAVTNSLGSTVGGSIPYITVTAPTLQVTAYPTSGTLPLTVQFTAASADSASNTISQWNWTFGDGTTSALQNPSHTYQSAGTFYPVLTATNSFGSAVLNSVSSVAVSFPTVQFTVYPTSGGTPLPVQFTSPNSDSGGNTIVSWNWNFGDGSNSILHNPSHTYQTAGIFYPSLIVTNGNGTQIYATGPQVHVAAYLGLVLNGGFETSDFTGWNLSDSGIYGYDLVDTFYESSEGMEPNTGSYFARLGQTGSLGYLSQSLATTPGAKYLLSFWLNSPDGLTPNKFLVSWNGNTLLSRNNLPALGWTNFQFVVTATAITTVLQFGFQDDPTALGLDDISVVPAQPGLTGLSLSGANVVASGSNGLFGQTYHLLASTNLALPLSQWTPVATNILNATGNFTITATNAVNPAASQQFYILKFQ